MFLSIIIVVRMLLRMRGLKFLKAGNENDELIHFFKETPLQRRFSTGFWL